MVAAPAPKPEPAPIKTPIRIEVEEPAAYAPPAPAPTLNLATIKERLGFIVTAEYLASLGFAGQRVKASMLYQESDWPAICDAICESVQAAKAKVLEAA